MTCTGYRRWLSPYVDGILKPEDRARMEDHLRGCDRCRRELESLQCMLQTLRTLESPATPELLPGIHRKLAAPPAWRRVLERFLAPWPASLPWHGLALATTALLVVVVANLPGIVRRDRLAQGKLRLASKPPSAPPMEGLKNEVGAFLSEDHKSLTGERALQADEGRPLDSIGPALSAPTPSSSRQGGLEATRDSPAFEDGATYGAGQASLRAASDVEQVGRLTEHQMGDALSQTAGPDAQGQNDYLFGLSSREQQNEDFAARVAHDTEAPRSDKEKDQLVTGLLGVLGADEEAAQSLTQHAGYAGVPDMLSGGARVAMKDGEFRAEAVGAKTLELVDGKLAPAKSTVATSALEPLQVQWRVTDFAAAIAQVSEWVAARQGLAVATNEHHLSIKLPASAVTEFLQQFATDPPPTPDVTEPIWLTLSLELIQ